MDIKTRLHDTVNIRAALFFLMEINYGFKFTEYDVIGPDQDNNITIILNYDKFVVYNIPL